MLARLLPNLLPCFLAGFLSFAALSNLQAQNPFDSDPAMGGSPFGDASPFDSASPDAGDAGGVFGGAPATNSSAIQPGSDEGEPEADPIVRLVRESPPSTPKEMAEAITWLTRIQRWDEVGRQLETVAGWDLASKATLARAGGPALWFKLRGDDVELAESQRNALLEVLRAPSKIARQPKWINDWIAKLGSNSPGERKLAIFRLQDSGRAGMEVLVKRILDGSNQPSESLLAQTVASFGRDGIEALQTACNTSAPERASRLYLALADVPGKHFSVQLGAALNGSMLTDEARARLSEKLITRYGDLPTADETAKFLKQEFENRLENYTLSRLENSELTLDLWLLSENGDSLQTVRGPADHLALRRLTNVATLMLHQQTTTFNESVLATTALLQQSYQVTPELLPTSSDRQIAQTLAGTAEDPAYWQAVFTEASERQLHGGALRALQLMGENVPATAAPLNFLYETLKDPRPAIRFSALQIISKFDPQESFLGADLALRTAIEMSNLANGPNVLVIGLQAQLRQVAQQQLVELLDARVQTVNSARGALAALQEEVPFEMVFIVDRVSDQRLPEMVQRLRMTRRARSLPIALLTDDLTSVEQRLLDSTPGLVMSLLSRDSEQLGRVVEQMRVQQDTKMLTIVDRADFSIAGKKFLARIAGDPDTYGFYHIGDYRDRLATISDELQVESQVEMLSGLGNANSQSQLLEMAANLNLDESQRVLAANRFGDSVKRFGMLLDREQVLRCYELYNRQGPADPISVRAIGSVLDTIESRARVQ